MYYPYLRAKQFELKALREFSKEYNGKSITPILEPVKKQTNLLDTAITEMLDNQFRFALILNPHDGDYKHTTTKFTSWLENEKLMENRPAWIPAFIYSLRYVNEIKAIIQNNELQDVMIIFTSGMDIDDEIAWEIVRLRSVKYVVNAVQSTFPRRLKRELKENGKQVIRLDDNFRAKVRNADYALNVDEVFTEEPFFFSTDEGLDGYSDYTTLPSEYIEGGMLPYALAIHLSYRKNEEQLNVHHFVSDSNETNTDIRRKFKEAADKIAPFYRNIPKTKAVEEIIDKANDPNGYPGLGYLKKLSIKNHLELINSLNK